MLYWNFKILTSQEKTIFICFSFINLFFRITLKCPLCKIISLCLDMCFILLNNYFIPWCLPSHFVRQFYSQPNCCLVKLYIFNSSNLSLYASPSILLNLLFKLCTLFSLLIQKRSCQDKYFAGIFYFALNRKV